MTRNTNIWISAITHALKRLHDGIDKIVYFIANHVTQVYFSIQQRSHVSMSARPRPQPLVVTGIARRAWQWILRNPSGTGAHVRPVRKRTVDHIGMARSALRRVQIPHPQWAITTFAESAASLTTTIPETTLTERRMHA